MPTSVRLDAKTESLVARLARRKGQTKSRVIRDPIHVNDLQATILHLFGLDHLKLTYRFEGRDFRLTDVGGTVVEKLLA